MYLIIFVFSISLTFAESLGVAGQRHYELNYTKDHIEVQTSASKTELKKKTCNQKIFEDFTLKIKKMNSLPHEPGHRKNFFNYHLNGQKYSAAKESPLAGVMDSFPEEIDRMKIEEKLRCKK